MECLSFFVDDEKDGEDLNKRIYDYYYNSVAECNITIDEEEMLLKRMQADGRFSVFGDDKGYVDFGDFFLLN